jgi:hypothetical protein
VGVYIPQDVWQQVSFTSPFKPQGKRKFTIIRNDYGTTPEKIKKEEEDKPP